MQMGQKELHILEYMWRNHKLQITYNIRVIYHYIYQTEILPVDTYTANR